MTQASRDDLWRDFPKTAPEFEARFATEDDCRAYWMMARWGGVPSCQRCQSTHLGKPMRNGTLFACADCGHQTSLISGTLLEGTRKPFKAWFRAVFEVASHRNGISAKDLQRIMGFGSYETAWTWLHKLRRAMVRPGRDCLGGVVEIDETYVGGPEKDKWGREIESKAIVAVAAEESGQGIGRIRLRRVADVSAASLLPFVRSTVAPGAAIHTDGWKGYAGLAEAGFKHRVSIISTSADPAHVVMPRVHKVASLLKRWLLGTHQGGVQRQHLDYYLDEFTFRFNRRRSSARGLLFHRLAEQAVAIAPAPYRTIIGKPAEQASSGESGR